MYGHCPATVDAVHFEDDYSESFKFGIGCHIQVFDSPEKRHERTGVDDVGVWKETDRQFLWCWKSCFKILWREMWKILSYCEYESEFYYSINSIYISI